MKRPNPHNKLSLRSILYRGPRRAVLARWGDLSSTHCLMCFDIVTIFPDFFTGPFQFGVVPRAFRAGIAAAHTHDLRGFTHDRHRTAKNSCRR